MHEGIILSAVAGFTVKGFPLNLLLLCPLVQVIPNSFMSALKSVGVEGHRRRATRAQVVEWRHSVSRIWMTDNGVQ